MFGSATLVGRIKGKFSLFTERWQPRTYLSGMFTSVRENGEVDEDIANDEEDERTSETEARRTVVTRDDGVVTVS